MDADGKNVRQLTFDQDHDWCPTVLNNGRVLYTRWEYSDAPHYFTRLLFSMNPDGTNQAAYYHSNSYWPNSTFYARPIPGHPTKVVAVISGHHGVQRMGELIVFDPALGRFEAKGAVAADPRLRAEGRTDHPRRAGRGLLAQIPPSLPAEREVLPGFLQAHARCELGHLSRRYVRQLRAAGGRAGLCDAGAGAAPQDGRAAGDPRPRRPEDRPGGSAHFRHLCRRGHARRAPRHGEEAADLRAALRLQRHGRAHQHRHRRPLGRPPHLGHGARGERRFGEFQGPGQHAADRATAGCRRQGAGRDAELVHRHAGRDRCRASAATRARTARRWAGPAWPCSASRRRSSPGTGRRGA